MKPTVHLIHGFIGSGKTTFARRLAYQKNAVRITPDEWMVTLFGHNPPADTFAESYRRSVDLSWLVAEQVLNTRTNVVMDFGFWSKQSREDAMGRVLALNATPTFYSVQCDQKEMLRRTLARSESPPADSFFIDENAFYQLMRGFEPMGEFESFVSSDDFDAMLGEHDV